MIAEQGWFCADCGSHRLRHTLGPCAGCGKSLDGEPDPKSRTAGMFHPMCWHAYRAGEQARLEGLRAATGEEA